MSFNSANYPIWMHRPWPHHQHHHHLLKGHTSPILLMIERVFFSFQNWRLYYIGNDIYIYTVYVYEIRRRIGERIWDKEKKKKEAYLEFKVHTIEVRGTKQDRRLSRAAEYKIGSKSSRNWETHYESKSNDEKESCNEKDSIFKWIWRRRRSNASENSLPIRSA